MKNRLWGKPLQNLIGGFGNGLLLWQLLNLTVGSSELTGNPKPCRNPPFFVPCCYRIKVLLTARKINELNSKQKSENQSKFLIGRKSPQKFFRRWQHQKKTSLGNTTAKGFEPSRAEPNGFRVHLLNHSDTLSWKKIILLIQCQLYKTKTTIVIDLHLLHWDLGILIANMWNKISRESKGDGCYYKNESGHWTIYRENP